MNLKGLVRFGVFVAVVSFCFPRKVYGYIDPGTGSYFLQILIAGLLAALYSIKLFWAKIRAFLAKWILPGRITKLFKW